MRDGKVPGDEPLDRRFSAALGELYAWRAAVDALADRHFQGQSPLLAGAGKDLDRMVELAEQLVERFNDHLEMKPAISRSSEKHKLPVPLDLAEVHRRAEPSAQSFATTMVDLARADAYEMMGERERAFEVARRHL